MIPGALPSAEEDSLVVDRLTISFGGVQAVSNASLRVGNGQIVSLIGPNGAGKTTLLNGISGFVRSRSGSIRYGGRNLVTIPAWKRSRLGIGRTFQNLQLFGKLSALDNVVVGAHSRQHSGLAASMLYFGPARSEDREARNRSFAILEQMGLSGEAHRPAGTLSLASQKLLTIARVLAGEPSMMLLDEPAAGMMGESVEQLSDLIKSLARARSVGVLLVEHNMRLVMKVSDHVVVMHEGSVLTEGDPVSIQAHPEVISVYLGTGSQEPAGSAQSADA